MKSIRILFSFIFLAIVFSLFLIGLFKSDTLFSYNENRVLEQKPEFSVNTIIDGTYTGKMESYVSDQIIFRDNFIWLSTYSKMLMGQKEINDVYICDDYLIETFKKSEIDKSLLNKNIEFIDEFLKNHSNAYIAIIPTATEILRYKIPKYSENISQIDVINNIYDKQQSIDIYSNLINHNSEYIYYRTDHHWTALGAYYGYLAICDFLNLNSISIDDFNVSIIDSSFKGTIQSKVNINTVDDILYGYEFNSDNVKYKRVVDEFYNNISESLYDYDKLETKEKYAVYIGGNSSITRIFTENGKEDRGRLLLLKDSFSHSLIQFLANHYSEIVMVDLRYYMGGVEKFLSREEPFDDILLLYNLKNFVSDKNLIRLNK